MYFIFFNLFSIFFNNADLYNNFEYIVNKSDNNDTNFNFYELLNQETELINNIKNYNNDINTYEKEFLSLININRSLLNTKNNLIHDIESIEKVIKEGFNNDIKNSQRLEQYKNLLKSIYIFMLLINRFHEFIDTDNYKHILVNLYIQNLILKKLK
jgi:hypothetical protein